MPDDRRESVFRSFPTEKKLEAYRCGMRHHPPDMELAWKIANEGAAVLPALTEKLKAEKEEADQRDLILILEIMSRKGYLKGRADVIGLVRGTVAGMKNDTVRNRSKELLRSIEASTEAPEQGR